MTEENQAQERIWEDQPVMTVVTPTGQNETVRYSNEAMKILRDDGVEAYEKYVKDHTTE